MKITQINHFYQITAMPNIFPVNVYLYELENEIILIDTGIKSMAKSIIQFARNKEKTIGKLLLTHGHSDHIGSLEILTHEYPDLEVYVSERESLILKGNFTTLDHEPNLPIKGGYPKKGLPLDFKLLKDQEVIGPFKAVYTVGHTPGIMSFWHEEAQIMVVGDAFQTQGGLSVAGMMNLTFPFPALATWSKSIALESAKKILSYNPKVLCTGHGNMVTNPTKAIEKAIKKAEKKTKQ